MSGNRITVTFLLTSAILLSCLSGAWGEHTVPSRNAKPPTQIIIDGRTISVEIADTPALQEQGLSDRKSLPADRGMLFIFPDKQIRTFWMRRMHFPLDIIWIDDRTIAGVEKNLPPEGDLPLKYYSSGRAVNYVLELNAGLADKYGMKKGDKVIFK